MAAYTITLYGTQDAATITPYFVFGGGDTVEVEIDDVSQGFLTSGVAGSFTLNNNEKLEYVCSDWDAVTQIRMEYDKVDGDISGWTLPSSLTYLRLSSTSVSGDISGWTLPNSLVYLSLHNTSVGYNTQGGAFTGVTVSLTKIDFDNCYLTYQEVDKVLADLVTSGITGKSLDIAGTNSGPSPYGEQDKIQLEADGWTISINAALGVSVPVLAHQHSMMAGAL